jgi:hypothetical protein
MKPLEGCPQGACDVAERAGEIAAQADEGPDGAGGWDGGCGHLQKQSGPACGSKRGRRKS